MRCNCAGRALAGLMRVGPALGSPGRIHRARTRQKDGTEAAPASGKLQTCVRSEFMGADRHALPLAPPRHATTTASLWLKSVTAGTQRETLRGTLLASDGGMAHSSRGRARRTHWWPRFVKITCDGNSHSLICLTSPCAPRQHSLWNRRTEPSQISSLKRCSQELFPYHFTPFLHPNMICLGLSDTLCGPSASTSPQAPATSASVGSRSVQSVWDAWVALPIHSTRPTLMKLLPVWTTATSKV
mmetsp:Transcript_20823/g.57646  ORF Transcript_20823/g.57646 Transcript_20823/m.57646 type:complete len:243 (+) Transcript_20823:120-848(+)